MDEAPSTLALSLPLPPSPYLTLSRSPHSLFLFISLSLSLLLRHLAISHLLSSFFASLSSFPLYAPMSPPHTHTHTLFTCLYPSPICLADAW